MLESILGGAKDFPPPESDTVDKKDDKNKEHPSKILTDIASGAELFHTPDDKGFASVNINDHEETYPIRSTVYKSWLVKGFYESQGKPPSAQALNDVLGLLEARARFEGEEHTVHTRIAGHKDNVYFDLADDKRRVVEITPDGWELVSKPPVKFFRPRGMKSLPEPVLGGDLNELSGFMNLPDEKAKILFIAWLVGALRPTGPYPVLVIEGEQGSAKSTQARIAKAIIDPCTSPLRTKPRDERDLMIVAANNLILAFDNLSGLPAWLSDALCRLSTGGGFSTRELYSDAEEVIFDLMRPLILNGITSTVSRMDLADRAIILHLKPIPETKRRTESDLWRDFRDAHPRILGGLLTAVSEALKNHTDVILQTLPRMADFAIWATAAEPALPWAKGDFMEAYKANLRKAVEMSLEADPVAVAVQDLMNEKPFWTGTASKLLLDLEALSSTSDSMIKSKAWPKAANVLSSKLRRSVTFLRLTGIDIEWDRQGESGRTIKIMAAKDRHHRHYRHAENQHTDNTDNFGKTTDDDADFKLSPESSPSSFEPSVDKPLESHYKSWNHDGYDGHDDRLHTKSNDYHGGDYEEF